MNASEFVAKLKDVANNYKTLYVMGCFGAPMNVRNKTRYCKNHPYNQQASRTKMIQNASSDTFGFDCVNLIKGILWGWNGDLNKTYGGASYKTHGVPDVSADGMIKLCTDLSTDFTKIEVGEAVWTNGHIGVYIGDGLAIECTPAWKNKVQITACNCTKAGYNTRHWKKHGKLPYINYDVTDVPNKIELTTNTEKMIWDYLYKNIGNEYGVAGLMGNLRAESALQSNNVQNSYERKLGFTDEVYTSAVDGGKYRNFVYDSAGYGLAQWTSSGRKKALLDYANNTNRSIGDLTMQLEFLMYELNTSYKSVLTTLKTATSVQKASDVVLTKFERPKDQSDGVKKVRGKYSQEFYSKYAKKENVTTITMTKPEDVKMKMIKKGSKGKAVKVWQAIIGANIDGNFGPNTEKDTIAFQKKAFPTDKSQWDGIVGDKTWTAGLKSIK